jgi:hypothetical protein
MEDPKTSDRQQRPDVVIKDGLRLDGRGFEMFRSVCEGLLFDLLDNSCALSD